MKKGATIAIVAACCGLVGVAWIYLVRPYQRIRRIRVEFASIQPDDTETAVRQKLTSAVLSESTLPALFWDETPLADTAKKEIQSSLGESIDTFFLPTTFVVSFDSAGRVVGKHIYD